MFRRSVAIGAAAILAVCGHSYGQSYGVASLSPGTISLYAGMANGCAGVVTPTPASPYDGCPPANIKFGGARTLAFDSAGNVYFVDSSDHRVRKITAAGVVSTFAGTGSSTNATYTSTSAQLGDGGPAQVALVNTPSGIAVDSYSNVYFTDYGTNRVRVVYQGPGTDPGANLIKLENPGVTPQKGYIYTVAGTGQPGAAGDGGLAINATFSNTANVTSSNSLNGVAVDLNGNLYITDGINNAVREVNATTGIITTVAGVLGGTGAFSGDGGVATAAAMNIPRGIAVDAQGSIFIADSSNARVRMVNGPAVTATTPGLGYGYAPGIIHTVAGGGNGTAAAGPYNSLGTQAKLGGAFRNVSVDAAGDVYLADASNYRIEKLDTNDILTLVAGNNAYTSNFPTAPTTLSGVTLGVSSYAVNMNQPYDGVINPTTGDLLVSDTGVNAIYIVPGAASSIAFGNQPTYLSSAVQYVTISNVGAGALHFTGLSITGAGFSQTTGGRTDCTSSTVLQPAQSCRVAILFTPTSVGAASGTVTLTNDSTGVTGTTQTITLSGTGTTTSSSTTLAATPATITSGQSATLTATVTAASGSPITAPTGMVTFSNGATTLGTANLANGVATLSVPGLTAGTYSNLTAAYAGDSVYTASTSSAATLQVVTTALTSTSLSASTQSATPGQVVNLNIAVTSPGGTPTGTVTLYDGTTILATGLPLIGGTASFGTVFLTAGYHVLQAVYSGSSAFNGSTSATVAVLISTKSTPLAVLVPGIISTIAGTYGTKGSSGDAGAASSALLNTPTHAAFDAAGNLYISDPANHTVREILAAGGTVSASSTIKVLAGTEGVAGSTGDGSAATSARLFDPQGIAFDATGNLYIADSYNNCIRMVSTSGTISTFAGTKTAGYSGDGSAANAATLNTPTEVAVDAAGNVYIADTGNNVVRMVAAGTGKISTIAGTGRLTSQGFAMGDGGAATAATFAGISGLAVDVNQNVFIADAGNQVVRKVTAATGVITTIAGTPQASGYTGDGAAATAAKLLAPGPLTVNIGGDLFIADTGNSVIREVDASGIIFTVAGSGIAGYSGDAGPSTSARLQTPGQVAQDPSGNLFLTDSAASTVRSISASSSALTFPEQATNVTSAPLVVRLVNQGASSLALSAASFSSSVFTQQAQGASDCSATTSLAAGLDCTFAIVGNSSIATTNTGTLSLTDNSVNNSISQQTVSLSLQTINVPTQTITFNALAPVTYGVAPITLTATASSGLPVSYTVLSGPATVSGSTLTINGAGTVVIQASQAGQNLVWRPAPNVQQSLVVNKASLTVTANNLSQSGGTPIQPLTYTITGFAYQDTQASAVTGQPSLSTTATSTSPGGIYPITITAGSLAATNYTFTFVNGTLTILGTAQTITFNALSPVTYGVAPITLSASSTSGLPVSFAVVSGPGTISGSTLTVSGSGSIVIKATQPGNANPVTFVGYGPAVPVQQTLMVNQAPLTISVANATRAYGFANPTFSSTITGTIESDVLSASYNTTATPTSAPGTYPITATLSGANAGSYAVTSNPGTLTITQAAPVFLLSATPSTINYGSSTTLTATFVTNSGAAPSGSVNFLVGGAVIGSAPLASGVAMLSTKTLPAGADGVTLAYTGDTNYAAATTAAITVNVVSATTTTLNVSSAGSNLGTSITLTATVAATAPNTGTPSGTVTFYSGSTSIGTATLSGGMAQLAISTLPLGSSILSAQYTGTTLYAASTSSNVTETVTQPFTLTLPATSATVTHGQPAEILGTITANNGYTTAIQFTCTGVPQYATCSINPSSFTPTATSASTTLTIEVLTGPLALLHRSSPESLIRVASLAAFALLTFGFRRRRRLPSLLLLVAAAAALGSISGCGNGASTQDAAPGTSTITITATSGSTTATSSFTLTIQ